MCGDDFEWDDAKAASNWRDHAVTFEMARLVFRDCFAIEWVDDGQGVTEPRFSLLGMAENRLLFVAYTLRDSRIRIISAGKLNLMSAEDTIKKIEDHDWTRFDALKDADVRAEALNDPNAQPLTEERLAGMKRVPRAKTLRRALGLTQEEFATRFHIPVGTLRDWEQGRAEPDQTASAYLKAIAGDPDAVTRALNKPGQPAQ